MPSPSLLTSIRSPSHHISLLSSSPTPSSFCSLCSSRVVDAGHMPHCHSHFPFSPQSVPLLHDSHQSAADTMETGPPGSVRQAQHEYTGALRALPANRAALTSPTPRQRLGSKYCPQTHTCLTPNKHKESQHQSEGQPQDVRERQPHRIALSSTPQQQAAQTDISLLPHLLTDFHVMKMASVKLKHEC